MSLFPVSDLRQAVLRVKDIRGLNSVWICVARRVPDSIIAIGRGSCGPAVWRDAIVANLRQAIERVVGVGQRSAIRVRRDKGQQIAVGIVGVVQRAFGRIPVLGVRIGVRPFLSPVYRRRMNQRTLLRV